MVRKKRRPVRSLRDRLPLIKASHPTIVFIRSFNTKRVPYELQPGVRGQYPRCVCVKLEIEYLLEACGWELTPPSCCFLRLSALFLIYRALLVMLRQLTPTILLFIRCKSTEFWLPSYKVRFFRLIFTICFRRTGFINYDFVREQSAVIIIIVKNYVKANSFGWKKLPVSFVTPIPTKSRNAAL